MKRACRWFGGGVVGLAVALLAAHFFNPITPGGFVEGGKVEGGRYFVVGKGHRYTEVPETRWRTGAIRGVCLGLWAVLFVLVCLISRTPRPQSSAGFGAVPDPAGL